MKLIRKGDRSYQAASHEDVQNPGVLKKVLLAAGDFYIGRPQMINWALLPAGHAFSPHFHEDMQEIFVIVKGNPVMEIAPVTFPNTNHKTSVQKINLEAGDTIVIDPNELHIMVNPTNGDVEYIVVGVAGNKNGKTVVVDHA